MKKYFILFTLIAITHIVSAQQSNVKRAVEKDMEKKYADDRQKGIDAVDERLDKWEESDRAKRAGIERFPTMSMQMSIEYPEKPKNNIVLEYYFKEYNCASVFKTQKDNSGIDRMIMNFKEGKSTTLMTDKKGRKTGMVMDMKMYDWALKGAASKNEKMLEDGDATLKATDEYQTIEGYKCRKFLYEDLNNKSEMWVCNDVGLDYYQFNKAAYSSMFSSSKNMNNNAYQKAGMKGVVIQHHIFPKGGRSDETIITMKNIKAGHAPDEMFSTAGYDVTTMPSMKDIWKSANQE